MSQVFLFLNKDICWNSVLQFWYNSSNGFPLALGFPLLHQRKTELHTFSSWDRCVEEVWEQQGLWKKQNEKKFTVNKVSVLDHNRCHLFMPSSATCLLHCPAGVSLCVGLQTCTFIQVLWWKKAMKMTITSVRCQITSMLSQRWIKLWYLCYAMLHPSITK